MLDEEIAKAVVEKNKPEAVLDGVIEVLEVAQKLLQPGECTHSIEFTAGCAVEEISYANQILRALRKKQYGDKGITIL